MGIVQTAQGNNGSGGNNFNVAFTNNIAAANSVVICLAGAPSSFTISGGTDTYTQDVTDTNTRSAVFAVLSSAGGYKSITFSSGGTAFPLAVWMYEVNRLTALDKTSSGTAASSPFSSGATATTTQANEIFFGVGCGIDTIGSADTATGSTSPWVNGTSQEPIDTVGNGYPSISGYKIVTSTGTATYSGSYTAGSDSGNGACVATFKYTPPAAFIAAATLQRRQSVMRASVY